MRKSWYFITNICMTMHELSFLFQVKRRFYLNMYMYFDFCLNVYDKVKLEKLKNSKSFSLSSNNKETFIHINLFIYQCSTIQSLSIAYWMSITMCLFHKMILQVFISIPSRLNIIPDIKRLTTLTSLQIQDRFCVYLFLLSRKECKV